MKLPMILKELKWWILKNNYNILFMYLIKIKNVYIIYIYIYNIIILFFIIYYLLLYIYDL